MVMLLPLVFKITRKLHSRVDNLRMEIANRWFSSHLSKPDLARVYSKAWKTQKQIEAAVLT